MADLQFIEPVSQWRWSVQEMLAHLYNCIKKFSKILGTQLKPENRKSERPYSQARLKDIHLGTGELPLSCKMIVGFSVAIGRK